VVFQGVLQCTEESQGLFNSLVPFFSFKLALLLFVLRFELNSLFLFFVLCYADTINMVGGKLGLEELLVTKIFTLEHSVSI
jgi:hypothetical protein